MSSFSDSYSSAVSGYDKSPHDLGRVLVCVVLLPMDRQEPGCVQSTGLQAGLSQEVLSSPLRAQHSRAVEVGPSLTPSLALTLSPCLNDTLRDPKAGSPSLSLQPPLRKDLNEQLEDYRLDNGCSFLLLLRPYL